MLLVEIVESALFGWVHDKLLWIQPGIGSQEDYMNTDLPCRVAASFNKAMQSDRQNATRFGDPLMAGVMCTEYFLYSLFV
jgi:hypothetical protein